MDSQGFASKMSKPSNLFLSFLYRMSLQQILQSGGFPVCWEPDYTTLQHDQTGWPADSILKAHPKILNTVFPLVFAIKWGNHPFNLLGTNPFFQICASSAQVVITELSLKKRNSACWKSRERSKAGDWNLIGSLLEHLETLLLSMNLDDLRTANQLTEVFSFEYSIFGIFMV